MLFCTRAYLAFFLVVFALYWSLRDDRARVWLLVVASFVFYAFWSAWLAAVVLTSATFDYLIARAMDGCAAPARRRLLATASVGANLGLLCYFKYANFFLDSLRQSLAAIGVTARVPVLEVLLPVGISFYTFEAINYVVEVYRGRLRAERNLGNFLLFILFFPHLVAGPIVRAGDFLPQVRRPKRFRWLRMELGARLFLFGLFKKVAIADRMALFVDPVFADPAAYGSHALWIATLAYFLQVYCDFSGYSDMALGSAHALGYRLARNFDAPFLAVNVADFWRRWHISLSTWLRDYLFIPLGGSHGGAWRVGRNLLLTMTLAGLWHGAGWNYVLWGALHGLLLVGHRGFRTGCAALPRLAGALATTPGTAARVGLTFLTVALSLVLFRVPTLAGSATVYAGLFRPVEGLKSPLPSQGFWATFALVVACHLLPAWDARWPRRLDRLPAPALGTAYAGVLTAALLLAPHLGQVFVYFQF